MKEKTTYSFNKIGCCCKKAKDNKGDADDNCCKNKKVTICKALDNYKASTSLEINKQLIIATAIATLAPPNDQIIAVNSNPHTILIVKPPGRTIKRNILYRQFLI